ncbi:HAD family hydrolase [Rhodococcus sp. BP-252]|uniref:HAD family hydrolase n=1 Tax=unclassified Rhodococcus (in: high G+C Gram-positive bacteria) TaxID=192944 RepID=UPI001C9ABF21|nr:MULTISPECIES: HAD family hydrolase [unclassified Rhodococcus (in: high G+C Gram-positive bacteria)]MBY6410604.1 HAD family hydrolase [Rhodococcus sp. BP-320]MBY6415571.1 HAD family hydrolase [Rhodococcus sp. BP-321]MBY6424730.1 HAD family hydrolase [Rhodococcus sp. BP-324]MBY6425160.1 HAD family hydrolase [Rhodococcus sp. BP-323]MBY6430777.1 HAD family hydrolase [Rhodococcus sp. BP-322]
MTPMPETSRIQPRLVASDVDGTLLDPHENVTPRTRRAVLAMAAEGTPFVLSTGRPPRWIGPVVEQLGYAPMCVCANGAVVYDSGTDRILDAQTLSSDTLRWLADIAYRTLPGCGLAAERVGATAHDAATPQFVSSPGYEHAWLNPDNTEVSQDEVLDVPAVKLLIRLSSASSGEMVDALEPLVDGRADLTFSTDNGLIELSAPGVTKASGLSVVAERLGVAVGEIAAFGDMPNDVPMLKMVGLGVAMGNAHPAALAVANEVTATNADDGVARVLERWW